MTAEQLRNSILQEAISGRLVPQDPNDEPASVLLEKIKKLRTTAFLQKLIRKTDLSYDVIEDEEKFMELPKGWSWCRLGELGMYRKGPFGSSLTKSMFVPKGSSSYKVYEQKNAIQKDYSLGEYYISRQKFESMQSFVARPGDIIVSCAGTIGETYVLPEEAPLGIINQALMRVKLYDDCLVNYWLLFFEYVVVSNTVLKGKGSAIKNIPPFEILKYMPFPLPPLAEQKRIVAKLEELLPIVEQYGKAQKELDELNADLPARLRQSILQQAISGRLVPQDPNDEPASVLLEKLNIEKRDLVSKKILKKPELDNYELEDLPEDIPTGWKFVKLRKICTLLDGEKKSGKYICMDAKFLRGKSQGVYLASGKFVKKGENVILVDGENSGEIFVAPIDGYMGSTFKQLWISKEMYAPYVEYLIKSFKETLRNDKKGAAIPHLKKELFFNLPIGIPPLAEQERIVAKIEELFAEIDKLK